MFRDSIIFYKKNSTEQLEADDNMIMKDLLNNEIKDLKLRIFQSLNESCLINTTTLLIQIRDEKKLKYTVPDDFTIENVLEVAKNRKWFGKEEDLRVLELNEEFKPVKEVELEEPVADIDYPIRIEPIEY
ncbi:hypothetical protein GPJ56_000026 [Histomonas meleagridis]|uniref:uncharacterized protein n=1 Tax=Histomonas meleagridis TaxID=135588 RepID=UPI00355AB253|nr:hypothetical protein GPJ56_000026 [Histomonas meleagridis]KAH0805524.1 hypothetical protein GO595_001579 [Histomonas meleagridis]